MLDVYMMRVNPEDGTVYKGYIGSMENTLKAKQEYVGGLIQVISLNSDIDIICNDEGKSEGLQYNRVFVENSRILDILAGNILAVRHDNEGNFTSIREEDIPTIEAMLKPILAIADNAILLAYADDLKEYVDGGDKGASSH